LADIDAENRQAASAPEAASEPTEPIVPLVSPIPPELATALPQPPPLPVDFSTLSPPTISPAYALDPAPQTPERLGDIFAPEQPTPPQVSPAPPTPPADNSDPGQFKIPGQ